MSYQYWELLTRVATGPAVEMPWLCRELVRLTQVERLFCLVRRHASLAVTAVDCDGYPLGYAEQRLADSEFGALALSAPSVSNRGVQVTRKVSRASKRTAVFGSLHLEPDWVVTLVLENRFSGAELASFDDHAIERWVVLVALAARLESTQEGSPGANGPEHSTGDDPPPESAVGPARPQTLHAETSEHRASARATDDAQVSDPAHVSPSPANEAERSETLRALEGEHWNISRAARALGMTRHGLKKRMRRLQVARSS